MNYNDVCVYRNNPKYNKINFEIYDRASHLDDCIFAAVVVGALDKVGELDIVGDVDTVGLELG